MNKSDMPSILFYRLLSSMSGSHLALVIKMTVSSELMILLQPTLS